MYIKHQLTKHITFLNPENQKTRKLENRTFDDQYRRRQVVDKCSLWKERPLIGRVQYLYTMEHVVKNIAYHKFQSISVTVLFLLQANSFTVHLLDPAYLLK